MKNAARLKALADVQAKIIELRRNAADADDPREREVCLKIADSIEQLARAFDEKPN